MRASLRLVGSIVVPLVLAPTAAAADEACSDGFARWVKLSEARVRKQPGAQPGSAQNACVAREEVRTELIRALNSVRRRCDASGTADESTAQTKQMLNINESFIVLLPLCHPQDQPPPQQAQKHSIAANRPCLQVTAAAEGTYSLTNSRCRGQTVLAVVERTLPSGKTECRGQTIEKQLQVEAPVSAPPQLNYQCILNSSDCTQERLSALFPECDW